MKIGLCVPPEYAVMVKDVIDYAEPSLAQISRMTDEEFKNTKSLLMDNGVPTLASNCFLRGDMFLYGDKANTDYILEYTKSVLDRASQLGIHSCVLGSGESRNVPEGVNYQDGLKLIDEVIYKIGDIASGYSTDIIIEPLNSGETNVVNTVAEGAEMVRRINHPNIWLLADTYHMSFTNESYDVIAKNGDILKHIHVANPKGRAYPVDESECDYTSLKNVLKSIGYDLCISIEGNHNGQFVEHTTQSIAFLKKVFC